MARRKRRSERVLLVWNSVGEPEFHALAEAPTPLAWDPTRTASEVTTVEEELDAILAALRTAGFKTRGVNIAEDLDTLVGAIRSFRPDVVFNLVEFFNDQAAQEAHVAGVYEMLGVPYTGAGPLALMTCQRKHRTKALLQDQGVATPAYRVFTELPIPRDHGIGYPVIVKPAREDASGGIDKGSVVDNYADLVERVRRVIEEHHQPALVERYVPGREIHVAILGDEVLPLLEFEFEELEEDDETPQILTYAAKWDPTSKDFYETDVQVPARRMPKRLERQIHRIARAAYTITGCRDYARVDMRIDADGNPYVLEVNPNPDLADGTGFMLCAQKSGRTFEKTIVELVDMALARGPSKLQPKRRKPKAKKA